MKDIFKHIKPAIFLLLFFTLITGAFYPFLVTLIAQFAFPYQANGSILVKDGIPIGSELIGQEFNSPEYFWGRLSSTSPSPYNSAASTGSNLGPGNQLRVSAAKARVLKLRERTSETSQPIPIDLVTSSASGLDPHITIAAAIYQIPRVAFSRGIKEETVRALIEKHIEQRGLGVLGEPRINVLKLNIALDKELPQSESTR